MAVRLCSGCAGSLATDGRFCEHCGRAAVPPQMEPGVFEITNAPAALPDRDVPWWMSTTDPVAVPPRPVPVTPSPFLVEPNPTPVPSFSGSMTDGAAVVSPLPPSATGSRRSSPRSRVFTLGPVILAIVVLAGLVAWGWSQKSSAANWRTNAESWESRASTLKSQVVDTTKRLKAQQTKVADLGQQVASLASEKAQVTDERQQLRQIVSTVPSVTGGLRNCASSALTVATDSLNYAAAFPYGDSYSLDTHSDETVSICSAAVDAADTLDGIVNGLTQ
jgi:hypothetical protein